MKYALLKCTKDLYKIIWCMESTRST